MKKNGIIKKCTQCTNDIYIPKYRLSRSKNHFCSSMCANEHQKRNKILFSCKTCGIEYSISKSEVDKANKRNHQKLYCSLDCRNADKSRMTEKAQIMNKIQFNKNGLNKLELLGREWLQNLGFILNLDFFEQVILFDKFTVDVFIPKYNLIVQFDGEYWHSKQKRKQLDKSQDEYLKKCGLRVFRITDVEFKTKDVLTYQKKTKEFILVLNPVLHNSNISFQ